MAYKQPDMFIEKEKVKTEQFAMIISHLESEGL